MSTHGDPRPGLPWHVSGVPTLCVPGNCVHRKCLCGLPGGLLGLGNGSQVPPCSARTRASQPQHRPPLGRRRSATGTGLCSVGCSHPCMTTSLGRTREMPAAPLPSPRTRNRRREGERVLTPREANRQEGKGLPGRPQAGRPVTQCIAHTFERNQRVVRVPLKTLEGWCRHLSSE